MPPPCPPPRSTSRRPRCARCSPPSSPGPPVRGGHTGAGGGRAGGRRRSCSGAETQALVCLLLCPHRRIAHSMQDTRRRGSATARPLEVRPRAALLRRPLRRRAGLLAAGGGGRPPACRGETGRMNMRARARERNQLRAEQIQSILLDRVRVEWEVQVLRKEEVSVKFVKS